MVVQILVQLGYGFTEKTMSDMNSLNFYNFLNIFENFFIFENI